MLVALSAGYILALHLLVLVHWYRPKDKGKYARTKLGALTPWLASTAEAVTVIASKFAMALHAYDSGLNRLTIPTTMRMNVQALLMAGAALEKDLSRVAAVPGFTLPTWSQEITPDANRVGAASNGVRADLGLQPL